MDSLLTALVDLFFFLIGKGCLWCLQKLGMNDPEFSYYGTVVFGLVATVCLVICVGILVAIC